MFTQYLFHLVRQLIFGRWAHDYEEHHTAAEDAYSARVGPLQLAVDECFVLDHADALIEICIPTPQGRLQLGYRVCLGEEQIRRPGFYCQCLKQLPG